MLRVGLVATQRNVEYRQKNSNWALEAQFRGLDGIDFLE